MQAGPAGVAGVEVSVLRIDDESNLPDGAMDTLDAQDAIIYDSPTYMGGTAWQVK